MPRAVDSATRQLWQQRLQRYTRSGLTVVAFCAREGISPASFYAHKRRLADSTSDPAFVPVRIVPPPAAAPVELLLPSGCILRLSPDCDPAWVRQLLDLPGVRPC